MSLFDTGKSCVFSSVEGILTFNGHPASGAEIKRSVEWQKEKQDSAQADSQGKFSLPALYQRSAMKLIPSEFVAAQHMVVVYQGKEYPIWETAKRSEEENAELEGKPLIFTCELTDEPEFTHLTLTSIKSNCRWN